MQTSRYYLKHTADGDLLPDVTGRDVLVFDFSYPRETMIAAHGAGLCAEHRHAGHHVPG